jgi:hypothetical protein
MGFPNIPGVVIKINARRLRLAQCRMIRETRGSLEKRPSRSSYPYGAR